MIRAIRNRFPLERWMRLLGWTTVGIACSTAVVAKVVAAPLPDPAVTAPPAPQTVAVATASESAPLLPGQGLVVLRSTPAPVPEPEVIVVPAPAGAASPAATVSSGS